MLVMMIFTSNTDTLHVDHFLKKCSSLWHKVGQMQHTQIIEYTCLYLLPFDSYTFCSQTFLLLKNIQWNPH